jgi:hypothetical protein
LCMVHEWDDPIDLNDNDDYLTTLVGRAPLKGTPYVVGCHHVHQILIGKVLGEQAEEWFMVIRMNRMVVWTLEGEGTIECQITQAEAVYKTLHYNRECSIKFSTFLGRMQMMFQIYKQENEEFQELAKILNLLDRVQGHQTFRQQSLVCTFSMQWEH